MEETPPETPGLAAGETEVVPAPAPAPVPVPAMPSIPLLALPKRPALPAAEAEAARGMSDEDLRGAQRIFEKFDVDGDGAISWDDFRVAMGRLEPSGGASDAPAPHQLLAWRSMFDAVDRLL